MQNRLDSLLSAESAQPGSFTKEISEVKSQLELIDTEKYKGALIRTSAERLWAGERPTKRSLRDEKRYAAKNKIHEIQYGNVITRDKKLIKRAFFEYYQTLWVLKEILEENSKQEFCHSCQSWTKKLKEALKYRLVRVK